LKSQNLEPGFSIAIKCGIGTEILEKKKKTKLEQGEKWQ